MSRIEAHPDAAIFPMMSAEELADLAADIKENGQRFPIVIGPYDGREVIIDGRNRYEACEIAGVEPKFEKLNGHDAKAFIMSVNVNRRHLTATQRAMAMAMIYPEPAPVIRDAKGRTIGRESQGSPGEHRPHKSQLSRARIVLRYSRPLAEAVLAGASLNDAFDQTQLAQGKISNETIRLRDLREARPDLAERVVQAEITLDQGIDIAKSEAEAAKQRRWAATKNLIEGVQLLDRSLDDVVDAWSYFDAAVAQQMGETITPERLDRVAQFAAALAVHMRTVQ